MAVTFNLNRAIDEGESQYPGVGIWVRFLDLEERLEEIEEFFLTLTDQKRTRMLSKLKLMRGQLESGHNVPEHEIEELDNKVNDLTRRLNMELPNHFFGSLSLILWSMFEASISEIADYVSSKEMVGVKPKQAKISSVYGRSHFFLSLLWRKPLFDETQSGRLDLIQTIRNYASHEAKYFLLEEGELKKSVEANIEKFPSLKVVNGYLILSAAFIRESLGYVESAVDALLEEIERRYPLRLIRTTTND